jgi:hypothetical protein
MTQTATYANEVNLSFLYTLHSGLWYHLLGQFLFRDSIFRIKKRIITVIANSRKRDSCHELLKKLHILTLQSQYSYIFLLLVFIVKNISYFILDSDIHYINTRFNQNLHLPSINLTLV